MLMHCDAELGVRSQCFQKVDVMEEAGKEVCDIILIFFSIFGRLTVLVKTSHLFKALVLRLRNVWPMPSQHVESISGTTTILQQQGILPKRSWLNPDYQVNLYIRIEFSIFLEFALRQPIFKVFAHVMKIIHKFAD